MPTPFRPLLLSALLAASPAEAGDNSSPPIPPCDGFQASPAFSPIGRQPATALWHAADLARMAWNPPPCTGWSPSGRGKVVAALAGSFRFEGDTDTLLARIGAISSLPSLRYWSSADKAWRPMARQAAALADDHSQVRRADFAGAEFSPGRALYYWMDDDQTGPVVYRMWVLERSEDRVVIGSANVSPVHSLFFTLFPPGALEAVEFLERSGPNLWRAYLLTRIDERSSWLVRTQENSSVNRLVALYRRLAELPADGIVPAPP